VIGRLTGRLADSEPDGTVVLDVGGVGYEVVTPLGALGRAETRPGDHGHDAVTLHVHTHVRDDAIELFGFATVVDRAAFRRLLSVSHVGPKLALAVLGSLSVSELVRAVESEDIAALTRISGVGKKTAQRIALELKGKLTDLAMTGVALPARAESPPPAAGVPAQLFDALVRMGWKPSEAERAVAALPDPGRPLGELVRDALAILSR
jgi:holliday junction DNA helicase RuvA